MKSIPRTINCRHCAAAKLSNYTEVLSSESISNICICMYKYMYMKLPTSRLKLKVQLSLSNKIIIVFKRMQITFDQFRQCDNV